MTNKEQQQDLVVLAADKDMEFAVRGIISRQKSLQIKEIDVKFLVHSKHDPGCLKDPVSLLRLFCTSYQYALVLLDHEGSGGEKKQRQELETQIESILSKNGWADRAAAIVIEPELEAWVWSTSPQIDVKLGWSNSRPNCVNGYSGKQDFGPQTRQNRRGPRKPWKKHSARSENRDLLRYLKISPNRLA